MSRSEVVVREEIPYFVEKKVNIFEQIPKAENWTKEDYERLEEAYQFAKQAHEGQTRKGTDIPYIVHPVEASIIAYTLLMEKKVKNVDVVVAAILHDVIEDTEYSKEDIANRFGSETAELVASVSENKREGKSKEETWKIRKEEAVQKVQKASIETKIIDLADKLSNLRATKECYIAEGEKFWNRFNQKDKSQHEWYYKAMAKALAELKGTRQYEEYLKLCDDVFGKSH